MYRINKKNEGLNKVRIMVKLTKKDKYGMLLEILAEVELEDKAMLVEFIEGEVGTLAKKAESAKGRIRAKKEDLMKEAVLAVLGAEGRLGSGILSDVLVDFEDATQAKITARLSALAKEGLVVKENITVEGRKLVSYKLA